MTGAAQISLDCARVPALPFGKEKNSTKVRSSAGMRSFATQVKVRAKLTGSSFMHSG